MKKWIAKHLRYWADRISPETAWRRMSQMHVRLAGKDGWVLDTTRGMPVWYYGPDYDRCYEPPVALGTAPCHIAAGETFLVNTVCFTAGESLSAGESFMLDHRTGMVVRTRWQR